MKTKTARSKLDIAPSYTDEEIFVMLELTLGFPSNPIAPGYRRDPGLQSQVARENTYYNDVTTLIMAVLPQSDIVKMVELRRAFYLRHNIHSFDYMAPKHS